MVVFQQHHAMCTYAEVNILIFAIAKLVNKKQDKTTGMAVPLQHLTSV